MCNQRYEYLLAKELKAVKDLKICVNNLFSEELTGAVKCYESHELEVEL